MRHSQKPAPLINAGFAAETAFFFMIFFLVATTVSDDKDIHRKLSTEYPLGTDCAAEINEHNFENSRQAPQTLL
ncbi:hypothetical protein [Gelidibacter maritimus]|uniref:Biopolymer transporter ExbD n=1 Tax=Gelidibacter maritimus TaxID=2761487 RepID=A0A7W2R4X4_9FLAO|nr:hypothetical protein [Gelidibacter maritimus]MBA6154153.1 hypothetical protein [Gelidibacter maritimus]